MSYEGARVVVTGGAGFIGSHLVEALVADGATVTVIDDFSTGRDENLSNVMVKVAIIAMPLTEALVVYSSTIAESDYIFHLAGTAYVPDSVEDPADDYARNLASAFMLLNKLRVLSEPPRLINVSSGAVYGNPRKSPIYESAHKDPISPYGVSKLAIEHYVRVFRNIYGLPAVSARLFSVYGPRQYKQVVYDLLAKLQAGTGILDVLGDGAALRDFIHVDDVVQALILIGQNAGYDGDAYNVATGTSTTIADLVEMLCDACGESPTIVYNGMERLGYPREWVVDIHQLHRFGFQQKVSLRDGLASVVEWYDGGPV
jgi:UDP-glucose 4-epimerase